MKTYEHVADNTKLSIFTGKIELDFYEEKSEYVLFHSHQWYELFYVIKGEITCNFEGECFTICEGEVIVVEPDYQHYVSVLQKETKFVGIAFQAEFSKGSTNVVKEFFEFSHYKIFESDNDCFTLAKMLLGAIKREEELVGAYFYALLTRLSFIYSKKKNNIKEIGIDSNMSRMHVIESVLSSYYKTDITIEKVAEILHISKRQLLRIIKKQYGCTYKERINQLRIKEAKELLLHGKSVEETAAKCGWNSVSAFYEAFHKSVGVSPGKYKKSTFG